MLVYGGIDEAGYGPLLGPLCVGLSVFRLERHAPAGGAPDLWSVLRRAVCRSRRDKRQRIAIEDSKKLKGALAGSTHPLKSLERGVLAFLGGAGPCPASDEELFERVLPRGPSAPWYSSATALPLAHEPPELAIAASRLRGAMSEAAVTCELFRCEAIDAGPFNDMVARTGNKAAVNLAAVLRLLDEVWRRFPQEHPRVIVDRQGGRVHYREELQRGWPDARIRIVAETDRLSRYRLDLSGASLTVSFVPEAESAHLPVALASMLAKYVRELFMLRLNRYFQAHLPELKPTAGYWGDGRRYLDEIEPLIRRLDLPRPALVRCV